MRGFDFAVSAQKPVRGRVTRPMKLDELAWGFRRAGTTINHHHHHRSPSRSFPSSSPFFSLPSPSISVNHPHSSFHVSSSSHSLSSTFKPAHPTNTCHCEDVVARGTRTPSQAHNCSEIVQSFPPIHDRLRERKSSNTPAFGMWNR